MVIISPSLLSANFLKLEEEISAFQGLPDVWMHLDIMDGHFVPNLTFGHPILQQVTTLFPGKLIWDAHLMVNNPLFYIESFKHLGLHNLTFHYESVIHHDRTIHLMKEFYPSVGISLNPSTPHEIIPDYLLKLVDLVLIMSVNPGFGGQKFIPAMIEKVKSLQKRKHDLGATFQIQVDGGVQDHNAPLLIAAGATNLVAGSYVFQAASGNGDKNKYLEKINSLRK